MVGKILDTHLLATLTRAVYANSPSQWVKSVITRYFFRTPYLLCPLGQQGEDRSALWQTVDSSRPSFEKAARRHLIPKISSCEIHLPYPFAEASREESAVGGRSLGLWGVSVSLLEGMLSP